MAKQLACIWPYSFPPLGPLIWMPALFFFLLLFCCHTRRLFLDGQNETGDPVAQRGTQLAVLRWVQLVGVRGSSVHAGQNWVVQRTTVKGVHSTIGFVMSVHPPQKYIFVLEKCKTVPL